MNINIQGHNYNNINLTQNNGEQVSINLPAGLSAEKAGITLLNFLNKGDSFTGQILDITQNRITISLSDNAVVTATLSDAGSYNIGDNASFVVKSNNKEQIILKALPQDNMSETVMQDTSAMKVLHNAGVTINEETVRLVNNLMQNNLPITPEAIKTHVANLNNIPMTTPEDIAMLTKLNLPVTEENVAALHDYNNFSEGISAKTQELSDSVVNLVKTTITEGSPQELSAVIKNFTESFTESPSKPEILPKETVEFIRNLPGMESIPDKPEYTAKEFLKEITEVLNRPEMTSENAKKIVESKEFRQTIENLVRQEFFIKPEDISKDNVKKLFQKIIQDTENLAGKFQDNQLAQTMTDVSKSIRNDTNFLNQINNYINYIQIPLKMAGQNAHGDLYVYKNAKRSMNQDNKDFTALLHLDMANLGPMDVFVALNEKHVTTDFKVATDEILTFIEAHMPELTKRLNALGYNVKANVTTTEENTPEYSFTESVFKEEFPPADIKRFSFDVRA